MFAEEKKNQFHLYVAFGLESLTMLLLFALNLAARRLHNFNKLILSFPAIFKQKIRRSVSDFLSQLDLMPL